MAKRNSSILDDLAMCPWWLSVTFAAVGYLSLRYLVPLIHPKDWLFQGIATAAPGLAPFAGIFLLPAAVSAFNSWRKGQLLEKQKGIGSIKSISWREFEELVGEAYRRKGYRVTETGGGGADGGVDLALRKNGEHLLVQCKNWRMDKVGVKVVRELYGVVTAEGATGGIVICSGTFTQEARDFTRGKPLELVGGTELARMVEEVKKSAFPRKIEQISVNRQQAVNNCSVCGSEMVLRMTKKGPKAGEKFWGCSTFPKCRGTKPYTESLASY